ncbi:MAG: hypothetical protein Ct9H300mP30_3450 [Methanobacteriota archaeon]|nr:MAG: hypothetical protein Ct9H300mP30_3450 [Euryarchaeota archaeon]
MMLRRVTVTSGWREMAMAALLTANPPSMALARLID